MLSFLRLFTPLYFSPTFLSPITLLPPCSSNSSLLPYLFPAPFPFQSWLPASCSDPQSITRTLSNTFSLPRLFAFRLALAYQTCVSYLFIYLLHVILNKVRTKHAFYIHSHLHVINENTKVVFYIHLHLLNVILNKKTYKTFILHSFTSFARNVEWKSYKVFW